MKAATLHVDGVLETDGDGAVRRAIMLGDGDDAGFQVMAATHGEKAVIVNLSRREAAHLARVLRKAAREEAGR